MAKEPKGRTSTSSVGKPWALPWEDIVRGLGASGEEGLGTGEIRKRRNRYGPNRLKKAKSKPAWVILVDQFKNLIILMLAVATILAFLFGQWLEGVSIIVAILINTAIGFFTELNAVRSMEALEQMSRVSAKVRRDGQIQEIPAQEMVPGDLVLVEGGDIVSADLRLMEASKLQADESALTGESIPVRKGVDSLGEDVPLPDRRNMLFKGTAVTGGSGQGVVVATGMNTELGRISSLAEAAEEELTPLEKRLNRLGYRLVWVTLAIAVLVATLGIIAGEQVLLIIETAIALAVAAIPEGLPIVATIALARGMWRMAHHNAVMNRLSAVETLGATNIIFTDKTGTLTENRMRVTRIALPSNGTTRIDEVVVNGRGQREEGFFAGGRPVSPSDHGILREALEIGVLCNNASLHSEEPQEVEKAVGDPLEVALLEAGFKARILRDQILDSMPEVREEAFDPEVKMMATFHEANGGLRAAVKGSPESVLEACSSIRGGDGEGYQALSQEVRKQWLDCNQRLAEDGLRVLAVATKSVDSADSNPYEGMTLVGLLGLLDPPRADVRGAVEACHGAGIRVIMVTGDQAITARTVGLSVGLVDDGNVQVLHGRDIQNPDELTEEGRRKLLQVPLFARVTPRQKLDLIALHQGNGGVVAMTGDGVNDAPALKKADIGIAMGRRGTQVAREAADMVLKDDSFKTIPIAIEQGRAIFENIRKFILYLFSGNASEIMIVGFALLLGAPLPILPLQILYLNMISDVFPALALGVGIEGSSKMEEPPRDAKEPILTNGHWLGVGGYGLLIAAVVLGAFALAFTWLHMETESAVTVSFLTLAFARLWHVFNMRDRGSPLVRNEVTRNPFVWGALVLCTGLLLAGVYLPVLSRVLELFRPGINGWILILGASLVPWAVGQGIKSAHGKKR